MCMSGILINTLTVAMPILCRQAEGRSLLLLLLV